MSSARREASPRSGDRCTRLSGGYLDGERGRATHGVSRRAESEVILPLEPSPELELDGGLGGLVPDRRYIARAPRSRPMLRGAEGPRCGGGTRVRARRASRRPTSRRSDPARRVPAARRRDPASPSRRTRRGPATEGGRARRRARRSGGSNALGGEMASRRASRRASSPARDPAPSRFVPADAVSLDRAWSRPSRSTDGPSPLETERRSSSRVSPPRGRRESTMHPSRPGARC